MSSIQIISLVVIIIITVLFIAWKIYKNGLRKVAIDLIVEAEDTLKNNREKFISVVSKLIAQIPFPFSMLITEYSVEKFVQKVFDEIKIALDYQKEG